MEKFVFRTNLSVHTPVDVKEKLRRFINLHHLNDEQCNTIEGKSKYPDKETDVFKRAHWNINASHQITLEIAVDTSGNFSFKVV